ncbi:regulatory protein RecX [Actinomyces vulturis]|uniref:regulatory protein RecX n=1 Tax=Actinomyces vulturis TaxID=1857645 RepID=UPI00082BEDE8|nr:regulatory protein RecX [Actinomyces vulturis]
MAWLIPDEHIEQVEAAREIALRRLDHSPASRHMVAESLRKRDIDENIIDEVLERLENVGLINDLAYAQMLVRERFRAKKVARRALTDELQRKGLNAHVINQALEQLSSDDEWEAIQELVLARATKLCHLDAQVRQRRLYGYLGRKGYSPSQIAAAIRWAEEQLQQ